MFIGYNFFSDQDSLNPTMNDMGKISKVKLQNGKFDEIKIDNDNANSYNSNNEEWQYPTVLLCRFTDDLSGGNVNFTGLTVTKLRLRRRKIEDLNDWWIIAEVPYNDESNLNFELFDYTNESDQEYEYALTPVLEDGTEGNYVTNQVISEFESAFLLDKEKSYKFFYDLKYGSTTRVSPSAKFEPLGSKYPIIVKNSLLDYDEGSVNTLILSSETENSHGKIDKKSEVKHRKTLMSFLANASPKILKDSNGNMWCISIMDNPSVDYLNELNQALGRIQFNWTEIGDSESKEDMYNLGLIEGSD